MVDIFTSDDNSTPLTPEESEELKPKWITLRRELNEFETRNILDAEMWLTTHRQRDILNDSFLMRLHKKMFGQVWNWAGEYRTTERNIGVAPYQIPVKLKTLFDDVKFWIENHTFSNLEIAVRLHHRLVLIHPFPNGNGRISRLMADLLMQQLGESRLYWGDACLTDLTDLRKKYIKALHDADSGDYTELIKFVTI
ncbi:MAG: mobile mystery protein B [Fibrobacter sp.]|nr:mobile mystery protein B [Fibrobacter sp.]